MTINSDLRPLLKAFLAWASLSPLTLAATIPRADSNNSYNCTAGTPDGPTFVDLACIDPDWLPIIDNRTDVTDPSPLHIISGHYNASDIRFNIYFPPKDQWQGRFFQAVYPLAGVQNETALPANLAFGTESGGYTVQTRGTVGYRHEAASAKLGRKLAAEYYNVSPDTIKGYAYGGSGGSEEMVGMLENTQGVWDGGAIFVQAIPTSIPDTITAAALGSLVLDNKTDSIADALLWGGSGNPYQNLTSLEASVYSEINRLGFPEREWEVMSYAAGSASLSTFWQTIQTFDPTYADDFWSLDGYLGTEQSELGKFMRNHRYIGNVSIEDINANSTGSVSSFTVSPIPSWMNLAGSTFAIIDKSGTILANITGNLNATNGTFILSGDVNRTTIGESPLLSYDNSFFLAAHAYYRHNIPTRPDFDTFYQFREGGTEDGAPLYPQRPIEIGPLIAGSPAGGGNFSGKLLAPAITVSNLLDPGAFAWNADWYHRQVERQYPTTYQDMHRVWYNENAEHENGVNPQIIQGRVIQYDGIYYQALRDIAQWVENGVSPPESSNYWFENAQVRLPYNGTERGGVQPSVHLCSGSPGVKRVEISVGQTQNFTAEVDVPAGTGCIIRAEWDFEGLGNYTEMVDIKIPSGNMEFSTSHKYEVAGTFYPVLRVASTRDCSAVDEKYVLSYNLDRNRVIVS